VDSVIALCDGRVGIFLQHLDRGLRDLDLAGRPTHTCDDVRELVRLRWERFAEQKPELAALVRRGAASAAGRIEGRPEEQAALRDAAMGFLLEDYTSRDVLTVDPVFRGTLA
jgi:hypothetical protein